MGSTATLLKYLKPPARSLCLPASHLSPDAVKQTFSRVVRLTSQPLCIEGISVGALMPAATLEPHSKPADTSVSTEAKDTLGGGSRTPTSQLAAQFLHAIPINVSIFQLCPSRCTEISPVGIVFELSCTNA